MDLQVLQTICNVIILIGGAVGAVTGILAFFGKPIGFLKKRKEKLEAQHREEIAKDVVERVDKVLTPKLDEIHQQNLEQNETINLLEKSSRDMLRQNIIAIYHQGKADRQLTETTREYLDDLYADYKAENGNNYIDKIYKRMEKWDTVPDED